jgi:hypothetical protein
MSCGFDTLRGDASPTEGVARRSEAERPRKQAPAGPADQVAENRTRDWLIGVPSSPSMYATHVVDGLSLNG